MKKDVHILLDEPLLKSVRIKCAQDGVQFQDVVRQLLAGWVGKKGK